jgi:hypothetical protein
MEGKDSDKKLWEFVSVMAIMQKIVRTEKTGLKLGHILANICKNGTRP